VLWLYTTAEVTNSIWQKKKKKKKKKYWKNFKMKIINGKKGAC
jgi:hypothetical protein